MAVNCAVFDERGYILLSKRGDLHLWNLPGGRLDSGEPVMEAAAREVLEETGIEVRIVKALGLYYIPDWRRLTILFAGEPTGGELRQRTAETRANRYFSPKALPDHLFNPFLIRDALTAERPLPRVIRSDPEEVRRVKRRLRLRWIVNLLRGRPEPRYTRFHVSAAALIWNSAHRRVLTLTGEHGPHLPRVRCDGSQAPWQQLEQFIREQFQVAAQLQWVGLWQQTEQNALELVFATTLRETAVSSAVQWTAVQNTALAAQDAHYVENVKSTYSHDPVWMFIRQADDVALDLISLN